MIRPLITLVSLVVALPGFSQKDIQKKIQSQLILADSGNIVELPEGTFSFTGTLSLEGKNKITIRGKGMSKTILSFKNQSDGAEGLRVSNGNDIVLEGFSVQDSKGDGIKTMNVNGITFRQVKAEWTGTPRAENGGYGLYPVQCKQVVIEQCEATGASDAGIYVGQSQDIIVRNNRAYRNVAGIEIENSIRAEVFNNEVFDNTGGILVFDLPDLIQKQGGQVKVYRNKIYENNHNNFAPKGNIVAMVPSGTGVMILATKNVEVYQNEIRNNQSVSTAVVSYFTTGKEIKDKQYDPFPSSISIHDNVYERKNGLPISTDPIGSVVGSKFGEAVPHILVDGFRNPALVDANGKWKPGHCISIINNKGQSIANLDVQNRFQNIARADDDFKCVN